MIILKRLLREVPNWRILRKRFLSFFSATLEENEKRKKSEDSQLCFRQMI